MAGRSKANEPDVLAPNRTSESVMTGAPGGGSSLGDARSRRQLAAALLAASLVLLTLVVSVLRRNAIETELRKSVSNAVSIEYPGLSVSVVGRDVTIRGENLNAAAKKKILAIAQRRRGVRIVKFAGPGSGSSSRSTEGATSGPGSTDAGAAAVPTTVKMAVLPPQVTAVYDATSITVSGDVPTVEAKDALLGRLKELSNKITLRDSVTVSAVPTEAPDLAQYRRLGTFFDTLARLPVLSADLNFDRTILTLKAEVADDSRRELLRRESVVLVGGKADQVRGEIVLAGDSTTAVSTAVGSTDATTTGAPGATSSTVVGETTTGEAGGPVTVPPLPATPEAQAAQTAITAAIDGRTIGFQKNSSALSDSGRKVVADVAAALKANTAKIEVGGHTDWKGPSAVNQELSKERADAVRKALIDVGVDGSRVTAKGYGEDIALATNQTDAGRAKNRRIEFRVIG